MASREGKGRDSIVKKMFKYEFMRELIEPSLCSFRSAILSKWQWYAHSNP